MAKYKVLKPLPPEMPQFKVGDEIVIDGEMGSLEEKGILQMMDKNNKPLQPTKDCDASTPVAKIDIAASIDDPKP